MADRIKNVMFGLKLKGMNDAQAKEIAMKYIKMVELEEFVDAYPKELSGGMKQRWRSPERMRYSRKCFSWMNPSERWMPRPEPSFSQN